MNWYRLENRKLVRVSRIVSQYIKTDELNKIKDLYNKALECNDFKDIKGMFNYDTELGMMECSMGSYVSTSNAIQYLELLDNKAKEIKSGFYLYDHMSQDELMGILQTIVNEELDKVKLGPKTKELAISFLGIKHQQKLMGIDIKGEINTCIMESATYYGNGEGRDPETY